MRPKPRSMDGMPAKSWNAVKSEPEPMLPMLPLQVSRIVWPVVD